MDILNFISWIKSRRRFTSVDPTETLLPVGIRDARRDDKYLTGAITVQELIDQIIPYVPINGTFGLFAQTAKSVPVTNTTTPGSLIGVGVGSLTVPANAFAVGDSFRAKFTGHMSARNNSTLQLVIKAGAAVLADTGAITLPAVTDLNWIMEIDFTIRSLGTAGNAVIQSAGSFTYMKDASNNFEGDTFSVTNATTFDTTVSNTLVVDATWGSADPLNTINSDLFILTKIY